MSTKLFIMKVIVIVIYLIIFFIMWLFKVGAIDLTALNDDLRLETGVYYVGNFQSFKLFQSS